MMRISNIEHGISNVQVLRSTQCSDEVNPKYKILLSL